MKGKRKPNGHCEKKGGRQAFKRHISERIEEFPFFFQEFGHLEGDTIVGRHHRSAIITLVERISKMIITIQPQDRKVDDIEDVLHSMFSALPSHIFKSITFDCVVVRSSPTGKQSVTDTISQFSLLTPALRRNVD